MFGHGPSRRLDGRGRRGAGAVRHAGPPAAPGRVDRLVALARTPQAAGSRGRVDEHVVRVRIAVLRGRCDRLAVGVGVSRDGDRRDVLRRLAAVHRRVLPAVVGGRQRLVAGRGCAGSAPALAADLVGAAEDRLAGVARAARRDGLLQRQHLRGAQARARHPPDEPARVDARRGWLGVLPRRQRAGLWRGVRALGVLAHPLAAVVDHGGQPARLDLVRAGGDRRDHRAEHERAGGGAAGQRRYRAGAICFFVGALPLVPEARRASAQPATA
jgi:hypothetical protein